MCELGFRAKTQRAAKHAKKRMCFTQLLSAMAARSGLAAQRIDGSPHLIDFALLPFDLHLLLNDLVLLFVDGVGEDNAQAIVLHTFDFAFLVVGHKQRIDFRHVFGAEADIEQIIGFPFERDRAQLLDGAKPSAKG